MPFEVIPLEEVDGVWRTKGPKSWEGCYYEYEVTVYHPSTLQVEKCFTTDPYSRGYKISDPKTMQHCFRLVYGQVLESASLQCSTLSIVRAGSPQMEGGHYLLIFALMT